jgi:hypothetical protein
VAIGSSNISSGVGSVTLGVLASDRANRGILAFAAGSVSGVAGRNQFQVGVLRAAGTSSQRLTGDGSAAGASNTLSLGDMASRAGQLTVIAREIPGAAWLGSTAYSVGYMVTNGNNRYRCTTGGTSASSGGPTGFGGSIADGGAIWAFVGLPDVATFRGNVAMDRGNNASTTRLLEGAGTLFPASSSSGASGWSCVIAADTTNGALSVTVSTGSAQIRCSTTAVFLSADVGE